MAFDNYVNISVLPKKNGFIDWKNSIGKTVPFSYRGHNDQCEIIAIDGTKVIIKYNNKQYIFDKNNFKNGHLGKLYDFATVNNYKYSIGKCLLCDGNSSIEVKERIRIPRKNGTLVKGYSLHCLICDTNFEMTESNIDRGDRCPVCSCHKIRVGYNDLWTTRPDIAEMLSNPQKGFELQEYSNQSEDITCPTCHTHIGMRRISSLSKNGLSCPVCSDGISFPNKFMYFLLLELNIPFEMEKSFEWCTFPSFTKRNKKTFGKYDFVLENKKIIIEMDGGLGHGNRLYSNDKKSIEESIYRDRQKDRLAKKHGYEVIRIDCSYYVMQERYTKCIDNTLNSKLSTLFNLKKINWDVICAKSVKSFIPMVCEMYNNGNTIKMISEYLKICMSTIIDYLHQGNKIGLCKYAANEKKYKNRNHRTPVLCIENGCVFASIKDISDNKELFDFYIDPKSLRNSISKYGKYKGLHFKKLTKEEFENYKIVSPNKVFGDGFCK